MSRIRKQSLQENTQLRLGRTVNEMLFKLSPGELVDRSPSVRPQEPPPHPTGCELTNSPSPLARPCPGARTRAAALEGLMVKNLPNKSWVMPKSRNRPNPGPRLALV